MTLKHSRLPLIAAAALAAGAYSAAGVTAGTTPWAATASGVAASAHVAADALGGRAGSSIVDAIAGPRPAAAGQAVRLDAYVRKTGGTGTSQGGGAAAATASRYPASSWAKNLAQVPAGNGAAVNVPVAHEAVVSGASAGTAVPAHAAVAQAVATAPTAAAHAGTAAAHPAVGKGKVARAARAKGQAAPAKAAVAHAAAKAAPAKPAPVPLPYTIYDSVSPSGIPQGKHIATYANGRYAISAGSLAGRGPVLWIDTNGSDPHANALDVEPGDATPSGAAQWVHEKLSRQPNSVAIVYTMLSEWPAVKNDIGGLPSWMQGRVRYWIADPTGVKHIVPGSSATQWYWGSSYDITAANGNFEVP